MSELPDRVGRAFEDHGAFEPDETIEATATDEQVDDDTAEAVDDDQTTPYTVTTTPFDAIVEPRPVHDRLVRFRIVVEVPMIDAVTEDHVAEVVEEGWYDTFERRIEDIGAVTKRDRDLEPSVRTDGEAAIVTETIEDRNVSRGLDDAKAIVDYVEGTYVQGIIPGYEYTEPVSVLISRARSMGQTPDGSAGGSTPP